MSPKKDPTSRTTVSIIQNRNTVALRSNSTRDQQSKELCWTFCNKTETAAPTRANTADTCAQKIKRKSCEPEPHQAQSSRNEQATPPQNLAGKRQKAKGTFSDKREEVRVMTWNVMGTTTVLDELQNLAQKHKPCIMVLTETKLTELEQDRKMLNTCLPDYKVYHSRVKGHKTGKRRTGSAGVTIAVHASLTTQNSVQLIHLDHPAAKGHCKCLKIQPPGSDALTIWGVYVPCTDMHTRKEVYNLLQTEMQTQDKIALEAGSSKPCHILAGDMNAGLYMDDRQTGVHPEDAMHQELMQTLKMHTTDKHQGMPRSRSYHKHGHNGKSNEDSRIDDIFISDSLCCHKIPVTTIADTTGDSDHSPIYATIPLTSMSFTRPGTDPTPLPREPRLKTPVPAGALQQYTEAIDLALGAAIAVLNAELDRSMETALQQLNPQKPNSNIKAHLAHVGIDASLIETQSNTLQHILEQLHPIAKGILPYTAGGNVKCFRMRSRRDSKDLCRLRRLRKALHTAMRLHRHSKLLSMKGASAHQATIQDPIGWQTSRASARSRAR